MAAGEDNIENWSIKFADSQAAAMDRDTWRQISIRSANDAATTRKRVVETKKEVNWILPLAKVHLLGVRSPSELGLGFLGKMENYQKLNFTRFNENFVHFTQQ